MNRPSQQIILGMQEQFDQQQIVDIDDSQAIAEAGLHDEQTQRNHINNEYSMEKFGTLMEHSVEEPMVITNNNNNFSLYRRNSGESVVAASSSSIGYFQPVSTHESQSLNNFQQGRSLL